MKTNFRLSSKMHLFIIISSALVALGIILGLVFQFVANGFFNYGDEWMNYKSIVVSYEYMEFPTEKDVIAVCDKAVSEAGVKEYTVESGETTTGGKLIYKFTAKTDTEKLNKALESINTEINARGNGDVTLSVASVHEAKSLVQSGRAFEKCAIAAAIIIVFHFAFSIIFYGISMSIGAVIADLHNLLLYAALLALTRIPVGSAALVFGMLTLVLTVIGTCFTFGKLRKMRKEESFRKLSGAEQLDSAVGSNFIIKLVVPAAIIVVFFVLMAISAMSLLAVISPILTALISYIVCAYGCMMFMPSIVARFVSLDDKSAGRVRKAKAKASK